MTMQECADEAKVTRRFLDMERSRRRLVTINLSARVVRVRRGDWEHYLDSAVSGKATQ